MTTERETNQIVDSGITELALGISGMSDEEAAQALDTRMRSLEEQWKRSFIERGLVLLEFEERKLWRLVKDRDTGQPYTSLDKWII